MASPASLLSEEQFQCRICLEVFNDPVSVTCGHNFCMACITKYWDTHGRSECPLCRETFKGRPILRVNSFISEMTVKLKPLTKRPDYLHMFSRPGDVPCDICSVTKLRAVKSCLMCQASYCELHLEPHQRVPALKRHKLMDAVENLQDRICAKHERPLEMFCKTDQMIVCHFCTESDHKLHEIVPLAVECEKKKADLAETKTRIQQMVEIREQKIQVLELSKQLSNRDGDDKKAKSVEIFSTLLFAIEKVHADLIEVIEEKQKATEKQAEGFIKDLEEEITELKKRSDEIDQLSQTEDHFHLLHSFPALSAPPHTRDWNKANVYQTSYVHTVRRAVTQLEERLSVEMKKLCDAELKQVQQYAVEVSLDPDTANPYLHVSQDLKQVNNGDSKKNISDNPRRFSLCPSVLGKQGFSSGRFYYEVQVKGKKAWDIGVAAESINRKGKITYKCADGFWVMLMSNANDYKAYVNADVAISLREKPQKVGVFVDYEEGLVSFYDVEARAHIYSFTGCSFTEKLFPYFCTVISGAVKKSEPIIISSIYEDV